MPNGQVVPDHLSDLRIRPAANTGDDTAALQQRTMQQAKAAFPQPTATPPWEEEPELPSSSPLARAYRHAKSIFDEHEQDFSEKVLAPFRQGLDNMAADLQQAAESGHTQTGGQLTQPTRALAEGVGGLLKQVPVGRDVKSTALAIAVPIPDFSGLRIRKPTTVYHSTPQPIKNIAELDAAKSKELDVAGPAVYLSRDRAVSERYAQQTPQAKVLEGRLHPDTKLLDAQGPLPAGVQEQLKKAGIQATTYNEAMIGARRAAGAADPTSKIKAVQKAVAREGFHGVDNVFHDRDVVAVFGDDVLEGKRFADLVKKPSAQKPSVVH